MRRSHLPLPPGRCFRAALALAFVLCTSPAAVRAQASAGAAPAPGRCGAGALPAAADSIDRAAVRIMTGAHVPALSLALLDHGRIRALRAYGWADLEHCVPATDSTLFGIGSISKHFTAVGTLLLVQAGKLSLDDPITKYLPEGAGAWDGITVRHLLTHTSGIPDYCGDDDKYPSITLDRAASPETSALVRQIAGAKLNFHPGDDWAYSNTGYLLLSVLVERVSGQPFPDYMREHVFLPAGMTRTRFYSPIEVIPDRAVPYRVDPAGIARHGPFISDQFSRWGDMGILSTARDMARWGLAMDSLRLISPELWRRMWTPVRLNQGWAFPYGFGLRESEVRGHPAVEHGGTFRVGYSANFVRLPDRGLTVTVLSNHLGQGFPPAALSGEVLAIVDPALGPRTGMQPGPDPQPRITRALLQLLQGADEAHGAIRTTDAFRHLELPELLHLPGVRGIAFLECTTPVHEPPEGLGTPVARACTYRIDADDSPPTLTFLLTRSGELAGLADW
ncbi:MAG TPA: serine hydrolase domain-containing protein [Longimicrobiales bacterium]|nr:serine hydrolase domain-containing protein [Longimicrobiales bacterium]